ncbi:MAG: hypothetical protein LUD79_04690 [Oscillospiraceae bacterium]|nr:hypothetical protein [Oscillospiraceae bacterium]
MLKVNHISLPLDGGDAALRRRLCEILSVSPKDIQEIRLVKRSIDARKKQTLHLVCSVHVRVRGEAAVLSRLAGNPNISQVDETPYQFPPVTRQFDTPPVVVGMGPAGLFAALYLARNGIPSIVLERGRPVEERAADVERFWAEGVLNPSSNVQFGEGGAGTFSDGKLTTGTHNPRIRTVLETFVEFGAPPDVAYSHKPHIGTDILRQVVKNIRLELLRLGCQVRFSHRLVGLVQHQGRLTAVEVEGPAGRETIPCTELVLAPGHSARDTFQMLYEAGLPMEQKSFAIGVRIEHDQTAISRAQFGAAWDKLPPADYKLSCHLPSGRSAFTFCVCPGGQVVASAAQPGLLVTNGMSLRARDGANINGGFLVNVGPDDFPGTDPLAGVRFQETWERAAFQLGGETYFAPAQLVGDFLKGTASTKGGAIRPTYRPGVTWTNLSACLPDYVTATLREALPIFDRKIHGFAHPEAVLTGVETRSSSPVRVLRGTDGQSALAGVFPCGEGCGYAGGIMSAAVDGVRIAELVAAGSMEDSPHGT